MTSVKKFLSFILPIILRALLLTLEQEVQKSLYGKAKKPAPRQYAQTTPPMPGWPSLSTTFDISHIRWLDETEVTIAQMIAEHFRNIPHIEPDPSIVLGEN